MQGPQDLSLAEPLVQRANLRCSRRSGEVYVSLEVLVVTLSASSLYSSLLIILGFGLSVFLPCICRGLRLASVQLLPAVKHIASDKSELSDFVAPASTSLGAPIRMICKIEHSPSMSSIGNRVLEAVRFGFRGLDIAALPERGPSGTGPGRALLLLFANGIIPSRDTLFIQTKVYPNYAARLAGPGVSIKKQVELFIAASLKHLRLDYVDSLLLHRPYPKHEQTMEAWRAMEDALRAGLVRQLGIAYVHLWQLMRLYADATLKPAVVYQRALGWPRWCAEMLAWCLEAGVQFQHSGLSPTSSFFPVSPRNIVVQGLAEKYGVQPSILFFRFVVGLGVVPLVSVDAQQLGTLLTSLRLPLTSGDALLIEDLLKQAWKEEEITRNGSDQKEEKQDKDRLQLGQSLHIHQVEQGHIVGARAAFKRNISCVVSNPWDAAQISAARHTDATVGSIVPVFRTSASGVWSSNKKVYRRSPLDAFISLLESNSNQRRAEAAFELGEKAPQRDQQVIRALLVLIEKEDNLVVVQAAAQALGKVAGSDQATLSDLLGLLEKRETTKIIHAEPDLAGDESMLDILRARLKQANARYYTVMEDIFLALGEAAPARHQAVLNALAVCSGKQSWLFTQVEHGIKTANTRRNAAIALGEMAALKGDEAVLKALRARFTNEPWFSLQAKHWLKWAIQNLEQAK